MNNWTLLGGGGLEQQLQFNLLWWKAIVPWPRWKLTLLNRKMGKIKLIQLKQMRLLQNTMKVMSLSINSNFLF